MSFFGKLFGSPSKSSSSTPTGFASLPAFGQEAFRQAVERGTALSENESLFSPAGLTSEQQAALATLSQGLAPTSAEQFQTGIQTFSNPFENAVVQATIEDMQRGTQGVLSDISSAASEAGGFGGTRQAVLEAEALRNLSRDIGNTSAALRSQGFQQAADRTLADLARSQDVASNLFNLSDLQRQIQTQQQQAPLQAVNFLQQLAQGLPVGGGTVSTSRGEDPGALARISAGLKNIGSIGGSLGGFF